MTSFQKIRIMTRVQAPIEKVWTCFSQPEHIVLWNTASDDWHTTRANNDFYVGGAFSYRMEAKDGSFGFDFAGVYDYIKPLSSIGYTLTDGRRVHISFEEQDGAVLIEEEFEAENENPHELQQQGWTMILDNFRRYAESQ